MLLRCLTLLFALAVGNLTTWLPAQTPEPTRDPLVRTVDLDLGEAREVELCDGSRAEVKLLDLQETRDSVRQAVRRAVVTVAVNGERTDLAAASYHLPTTIAGVRIDCAVTKGYTQHSRPENPWGLAKDARIRLWPADSPLIDPETFSYPAKMKWFASDTQMASVPVFVDGGDSPGRRETYYHYGLDFGGAEGMVDVVAATDGLVVSSAGETLPGYDDTPVAPRYDVVYLVDDRGWYYRYSHMKSIEDNIVPGDKVQQGQKIGVLGKEGGSGGWSHLHFDIKSRQPSGMWGTQAAYGFVWEAYQREYKPKIVAVARPHHLLWTGESAVLDGGKSWSEAGGELRYDWTFTDGKKASGAKVTKRYDKPGAFSEILKVTDSAGHVDYDFQVVHVIDRDAPEPFPPTIHAAYAPTFGIRPADPVTFKVRTFRTDGGETWDFGDGSPPVQVRSDGNAKVHAEDGYAVTLHRFAQPGHYVVRVEHTGARGAKAIAHLQVLVQADR
jgi:murein DD-endopeptidase MepM/ murein hydrolase activator NlpD